MRNLIKLPTIQNVVAGGHATLAVPLALTYDQIILVRKDCSNAEISNFKVKMSGDNIGTNTPVDVSSLSTIADLNSYYGRNETVTDANNGNTTIWFYRPEKKNEADRARLSVGTADLSSFTIDFDIDAGAAGVEIEAYAVQSLQVQPLGLIAKIREFPASFATAGKQEIDNITKGARIMAMHLGKADVSYAELEINTGSGKTTVVEADKAVLESLQSQFGRSPVTGSYTHIDLDLLGNQFGPMPTAGLQDMRVKPTLDSSGQLTTLVEYVDQLAGL